MVPAEDKVMKNYLTQREAHHWPILFALSILNNSSKEFILSLKKKTLLNSQNKWMLLLHLKLRHRLQSNLRVSITIA
jgi:hypothetical protein